MNLTVQGKPIEYEGGRNLLALLEELKEEVLYVTVRHNGEILERRDFENIALAEGDSVDFLYFMGGGEPGSPCADARRSRADGPR